MHICDLHVVTVPTTIRLLVLVLIRELRVLELLLIFWKFHVEDDEDRCV